MLKFSIISARKAKEYRLSFPKIGRNSIIDHGARKNADFRHFQTETAERPTSEPCMLSCFPTIM